MITTTFHGVLVAKRVGIYTEYVFQNKDNDEYVLCTKPPNWDSCAVTIGDDGYVTVDEVSAGDSYIDTSGITQIYKYSKIYFKNFIRNNNTQNIKIL